MAVQNSISIECQVVIPTLYCQYLLSLYGEEQIVKHARFKEREELGSVKESPSCQFTVESLLSANELIPSIALGSFHRLS